MPSLSESAAPISAFVEPSAQHASTSSSRGDSATSSADSPDESRDTLYLSNYATLHIKDVLSRLPGVGDVQFHGGREYAMRIWLDPDKAAAYDLTASDVSPRCARKIFRSRPVS